MKTWVIRGNPYKKRIGIFACGNTLVLMGTNMTQVKAIKINKRQGKDELAEILMREDHILEVRLRGMHYGKPEIIQLSYFIKQLTGSSASLLLIVADDRSQITLEGLKCLFIDTAQTYQLAKAYVLKKKSHFNLARVCLILYNPVTPVRFFESSGEAESWLRSVVS
jgi:hypothetical protein